MKRVAFITDLHLDEQMPIDYGIDAWKNLDKVLNDIQSKNIREIIVGGDIGEPSALKKFFDLLKNYSFNIILGNHDKFENVSRYFSHGNTGELFYSVEDDSGLYIFLDSSLEEISSTQLRWLKNQINTEKQVVVFIHHPVLDLGVLMDIKYPLQNRDEVRNVLEQSPAPVLIFSGHYHMNDERVAGNIRQIVTHAVSFQVDKFAPEIVIKNDSFGYRIIEIRKDIVATEIINFASQTD